jgi:cyanate permease
MQIADLTGFVGVILQTFNNFYIIGIGRLFAGIAMGINSVIVPILIKEFSPYMISGQMGAMHQIFICLGILISNLLCLTEKKSSEFYNSQEWRFIMGFPIVFTFSRFFMLLTCYREESPLFYMRKN